MKTESKHTPGPCPSCHDRKVIIPMGYQGEPVDCPSCTPGHTPGPLSVDYSGPARLAIIDTLGRDIAHMCLQSEDGDEDRANAVLFASAPDLLRQRDEAIQALKAIVARINGEWDEPNLVAFGPLLPDAEHDCSLIASAVIARVEGGVI